MDLKDQIERMQFVVDLRSEFELAPISLRRHLVGKMLQCSVAVLSSLRKLEEIERILRHPGKPRDTTEAISKVIYEE